MEALHIIDAAKCPEKDIRDSPFFRISTTISNLVLYTLLHLFYSSPPLCFSDIDFVPPVFCMFPIRRDHSFLETEKTLEFT